MVVEGLKVGVGVVSALLLLSACTPLQQYRQTGEDVCVFRSSQELQERCESSSLQRYADPADPESGYLLGFIEFDDQGLPFDREQMHAVVGRLNEEAGKRDLLIVVFMHGWKHSAAPGDDNIDTFREVLKGLAAAERRISAISGLPAREVAGVYLGWRGGSLTLPLLKELTFWERKNTAEKVGRIGVTEVLSRLERVQRDKDSIPGSRTRLVVVGHSFGGAAVFSALSQILESRFVRTRGPAGTASDVEGFGNLVVLINPAFEALLFAPLSDMSAERGTYFASQLPVLVALTSEADDATRLAFPLGRHLSTLFENERDTHRRNATTRQDEAIDEGQANVTALGHFEPYRTHVLRATGAAEAGTPASPSTAETAQRFVQTCGAWEQDKPGSRIAFEGAELERSSGSAGRNPYLLVYVDGELIEDHNDIADPRIVDFIKQVILISSQDPAQRKALESQCRQG